MSKSFSQAPKPPQLTAEDIAAFERGGAGQDRRARISPIVGNRDATNVGDGPVQRDPDVTGTPAMERPATTNVEMGKHTNAALGVPTKEAKAEPTRRLSIDLPESWHRRFKIACTRADRKMIDEVTDFIKRRTVELEKS